MKSGKKKIINKKTKKSHLERPFELTAEDTVIVYSLKIADSMHGRMHRDIALSYVISGLSTNLKQICKKTIKGKQI